MLSRRLIADWMYLLRLLANRVDRQVVNDGDSLGVLVSVPCPRAETGKRLRATGVVGAAPVKETLSDRPPGAAGLPYVAAPFPRRMPMPLDEADVGRKLTVPTVVGRSGGESRQALEATCLVGAAKVTRTHRVALVPQPARQTLGFWRNQALGRPIVFSGKIAVLRRERFDGVDVQDPAHDVVGGVGMLVGLPRDSEFGVVKPQGFRLIIVA